MSEEQRASQIGSGLTSRFRNQLSAYNNYTSGRARTMEGTADAYRQNLISMYAKSDNGKLMSKMLQGQSIGEVATGGTGVAGLAGKGIQSALKMRLKTLQGRTADARAEVDRQFPEQEDVDTSAGTEEATVETTSNPVINQSSGTSYSGTQASAVPEDFSGGSSGIEGVSDTGAIQVSRDYTQEAAAPETEDITSQLPTEGLGAASEAAPPPPPPPSGDLPTGYTDSSQLGLSEEGMAARNTALQSYSDQFSQAPRQVIFDNTQDPPLSDIMDRMKAGDLTLGESPAEARSAEQAGQRLSNLLDTSAEQADTTSLAYGGAAEQEAIARGAPSIDIGAGQRAITQTELSRPQPTTQQPDAPRPTEPVSEDSPFNPAGGATEQSTDLAIDANTHRSLTQAVENPNSSGLESSASQNVEQVSADIGKTADIGEGAEEGLTAGQSAAATGLEGAIGAEAGVEAGIGVLGAASTALGVLAPLGLLGFGLYEAISGEKQAEQQAKKQDQAAAMEQSEIQVEDQQSQFTQGRPSFGSMSLAPNLDMTQ